MEHLEPLEPLEPASLAVYRQEREHLRRVKDVADRDQIMIGVLETDITRAVVDRLNAAVVE